MVFKLCFSKLRCLLYSKYIACLSGCSFVLKVQSFDNSFFFLSEREQEAQIQLVPCSSERYSESILDNTIPGDCILLLKIRAVYLPPPLCPLTC